jgi:predicted NUDIX family phosphoesterase
MSKFEQVIAIRRDSVADKLPVGMVKVSGTEEEKLAVFNDFFKPEELVMGSRHWIEKDENYLQLIPRCVFRKPDGKVAYYQRAKGSGESRLLGNHSVNFGGHVNTNDVILVADNELNKTNEIDIIGTVWHNMYREIEEELGLELDIISDLDYDDNLCGFRGIIYDDSNSVGRVHLGLVFIFDVAQEFEFTRNNEVQAESEGMILGNWWTPFDLLHGDYCKQINLENWAKIVCEYLEYK